ncbi:L,D-transpeptidase family protein [Pelagibius sp.]|uniref:L,D-transpeptidase family protein n=1 Tax=Pelagibius sp. TaxID=1931238 RepID=UPI003C7B5743
MKTGDMIVCGITIRASCLSVCLLWASLALAPLPAAAAALEDALGAQLRAGVGTAATDDEIESLTVLERFYQARGLQPVWVDEAGASPRARQLTDLLLAADLDALDPRDYGAEQIVALLEAREPGSLAELEVRLTQGLVRYAADLGQGRTTPHIADPALFVFREEVRKEAVLAAAAEAEDLRAFVESYRPDTVRYDRQKVALAEYRALATQGGWQPLPQGPTLKPGMTDPRVGLLRERLRLWGDLKPDQDLSESGGDPYFYDDKLVEGVKWMQYRHGLTQDGAVGRKTLAALNVPIETRIEQMVLNLERRRWMPDDLGQRHIFVNIARKELLPKIKQNASYLAEHNFTLFSDWSSGARVVDPLIVDWAAVNRNNFPYKLRQGSGDGNALGRVKFMFPNRFNIYLHDTPAKALFGKDERTFSHGCIRVSDPPAGKAALHWRLLSSADIAPQRAVQLYRLRWRIEQLFRTCKSDGLRFDETQMHDAGRLMKFAAMALGAAARIMQLVDARDGSRRPATDALDAGFLPALQAISKTLEGNTERQKNPHPADSLAFLAWVCARLGGWNCYYKPPGPKTMKTGWQTLAAQLTGFALATNIENV